MSRHSLAFSIALLGFIGTTSAQPQDPPATSTPTAEAPLVCAAEEATLDAVNAKYQKKYDALDEEPTQPESFNLDVVVTYKNQDMSFDIPEVTMGAKKIALHTVQATMRTRTMSFKRPVVVMENRVIGHNVETKCEPITWKKPVPKCTVYRTPIITKVPTTKMELKEVKWDAPDFTMKRTEVAFKVPEFTMKRQNMIVKLPQFTFRDVAIALTPEQKAEAQRTAADKRAKEAQAISGQHKAESGTALDALFTCHRTALLSQRKSVSKDFEDGIKQLRAAITTITAAEGDPTRVPSEGGEVNLVAQLEDLIAKRDESLKGIDDALAEIEKSQEESFKRFTTPPETSQGTQG
jgi:hypothetical protein